MTEGTGMQENLGKPPIVTPEQIGFRQIGSDVLEINDGSPITRIDKTVDRKSRWEGYLNSIGERVKDPKKSKEFVTDLKSYADSLKENEEKDPREVEVIDFVRGMIVSFSEPAALKHTLARGARESMQDSIARFGEDVTNHFLLENPDLTELSHCSLALAEELYSQEHGGNRYQTPERKAEIATMEKNAAQVKIK